MRFTCMPHAQPHTHSHSIHGFKDAELWIFPIELFFFLKVNLTTDIEWVSVCFVSSAMQEIEFNVLERHLFHTYKKMKTYTDWRGEKRSFIV